jgi:hypothetical protein
MKTIETQNKMIAEFMGLEIITDGISLFDTTYKPLKKYHASWDCLMPVVEKIENSSEFIEVLMYPQGCTISKTRESIEDKNYFDISIDRDTKIEAVHYAVCEFIEWYNKK